MQPPLGGSIMLDGIDIAKIRPLERAKLLSIVSTEKTMAGLLTGYAMVSFGRYPFTGWFGDLSVQDHLIVEEAIALVGAESLRDRMVSELSDGERQRIMLARALAQQTKVLILDEITAFLDLPRRIEMIELLRRLARELGRIVLISIHDLDLALRSADRVILIEDGGFVHDGAPEDLVLNGAFARAFEGNGVKFDEQTGGFRFRRDITISVKLLGEPSLVMHWTRLALERAGAQIVRPDNLDFPSDFVVKVNDDNSWYINSRDSERNIPSIYELIEHFNEQAKWVF